MYVYTYVFIVMTLGDWLWHLDAVKAAGLFEAPASLNRSPRATFSAHRGCHHFAEHAGKINGLPDKGVDPPRAESVELLQPSRATGNSISDLCTRTVRSFQACQNDIYLCREYVKESVVAPIYGDTIKGNYPTRTALAVYVPGHYLAAALSRWFDI